MRVLLAVLLALTASGCAAVGGHDTPAPGSPTRAVLEQLLSQVRTVHARPHPGGYERGCKAGQGCVFGPAWSDDHDGPGGHDGCDTRNNVLAAQLAEVAYRSGAGTCVVVGGTLIDPYTGRQLVFAKADAKAVQIDHVYPLAAAWDMGAAGWTPARRMVFANDTALNLLAVEGRINQAKSDKTPASWLPPAGANHCFYAGKYLTVAVHYDLPVTKADRSALQRVARGCPAN
ncbi:HNH endonuclease family protein [Nocardia sp. NPDC055321]